MTYGASDARTYTVKDATYPKKGSLLTIQTSDGLVDLTTATEVCHLIAVDESSRDADGTLVASGATVTAIPVGGVSMVLMIASQSMTAGDEVFVGAGGLGTITSGSSKKLGINLGPAVTTAAGLVYPVNTNGAEQI